MGYVFNFSDANDYHCWMKQNQNRSRLELENRLMIQMLKPISGETVLDIGCGTGFHLNYFLKMGLEVTGLDPSPYMLDIAKKKMGHRVDLYREYAENMPFEDNSFNHACLVTTLEFVDNPRKALEETFRVTKDRVFIGVLNRYAFHGIQLRVKGMFKQTIYNRAQFFSIWELKRMIRSIAGNVPLTWRTVCQFPIANSSFLSRIEASPLVQRCPIGSFIGVLVTLIPRFKTRALPLKYRTKQQATS